jgi:hypothetical protein
VTAPPPQALKASTVRIIRLHALELRKNFIHRARVDSLRAVLTVNGPCTKCRHRATGPWQAAQKL